MLIGWFVKDLVREKPYWGVVGGDDVLDSAVVGVVRENMEVLAVGFETEIMCGIWGRQTLIPWVYMYS